MKRGDKAVLLWAIREAADWRGYYVGHPDAYRILRVFDARIRRARAAVAHIAVRRKRRIKP